MENTGMSVNIAGNTFRSGAVERNCDTHKSHLSSLHPPSKEGDPPIGDSV